MQRDAAWSGEVLRAVPLYERVGEDGAALQKH